MLNAVWDNLVGKGGLFRVRAFAFLGMLAVTAYLFISQGSAPQELLSLDLAYGGFYFGTRAGESSPYV